MDLDRKETVGSSSKSMISYRVLPGYESEEHVAKVKIPEKELWYGQQADLNHSDFAFPSSLAGVLARQLHGMFEPIRLSTE